MASLHVIRVGLSVWAKLPRYAFEQYLPASLDVMGQQLAEQVDNYVQQNKLGYYPALEFIKQQSGAEAYLLDAADQVAQLAIAMAKEEVTRILQPVFSSLKIESILSLAYAMPPVRTGQKEALAKLSQHYIPDTVKFELYVTLLQRHPPEPGIEISAKKMAWRWLKDAFEDMDITSARLIT